MSESGYRLRREVARLDDRIAELEQQLANADENNLLIQSDNLDLTNQLIAKDERIAELEQQLVEARKDGERLEHIEEFGLPECRCPEPVSYPAYQVWMVNGKESDTLRHAIDNAMKGQDDE